MSIYASTRAMYEILMHQMIYKVKNGENYEKDLTTLLDYYNDASASCERLLAKTQELREQLK